MRLENANQRPADRTASPEELAFQRETLIRDALAADAIPGGFTLRDEANALVAWAFRNGPLERLHCGKHSDLLEDDSLSRITDAEMKILVLDACQTMESLLRLRESDPEEYAKQIRAYGFQYCRQWER